MPERDDRFNGSRLYGEQFMSLVGNFVFAMNRADSPEIIEAVGQQAYMILDPLIDPMILGQAILFGGEGAYPNIDQPESGYRYRLEEREEFLEGISQGIVKFPMPDGTGKIQHILMHQVDFEYIPEPSSADTEVVPQIASAYISLHNGHIVPKLETLLGSDSEPRDSDYHILQAKMYDLLVWAEGFHGIVKSDAYANFSPAEEVEELATIIAAQEKASDIVERVVLLETDAAYTLQFDNTADKIRHFSFKDQEFGAVCLGIDYFERLVAEFPQVDFRQLAHKGPCLVVAPLESMEERGIFANQSLLIPLVDNSLGYTLGGSVRE